MSRWSVPRVASGWVDSAARRLRSSFGRSEPGRRSSAKGKEGAHPDDRTRGQSARWLCFRPCRNAIFVRATAGAAPRTSPAAPSGFSPNVDVYYCGEPQRAVVKVDLAGVKLEEIGIEVSGRQLAIVGERQVQETEGRVYQQVEIPSGPFRRIVELQVDVDPDQAKATYEDGVLRIELPLRDPADSTRRVPIGRASAASRREAA